mgnify:CR=1 FL=1
MARPSVATYQDGECTLSPSPTLTPRAFVDKWRYAADLKERSAAQEHFIDLCRLIGHPTPAEDDPAGERFAFEAGAAKHGGGEGWADVWKRGAFAWEYKGRHADLRKAYDQLLQYREALENPPLLIVSDLATIEISTNFTNTVKQTYTLTLDDLLDTDKRRILHDAFFDPEKLKARQTPAQVTEKAAGEFATLAEQLRAYGGVTSDEIAHFLIRLLFCLFAEDAGLLPAALFSTLIQRTQGASKAFQQQLQQLFAAMAEGGWFGADKIRAFDGHLFDGARALELDGAGMHTLARISKLDWSSIEPSIFGTLFERSLDPDKRSQLGAHYTSKEDILLIVEPVLMAPLRRKWAEVQAQAHEVAGKQAAQKTSAGKRGTASTQQARHLGLLQDFARELATVTVLDPACGSGNFLYVALRQLLDLWKEVATAAFEAGSPQWMPLEHNSPSPEQLHGIEVNPYAYELAQVTIWIGYIQWMQDNGYGYPTEPILKPLDTIRHMDAILAYDADGKPVEPAWPRADVIIGNPPFLGGNKIRQELGDTYVEDLFALYQGRVPAFADLVCYWFEKARGRIATDKACRAGLLATQAIRGGVNRKVLERIKETGDIFWATSDRDWILDGAAVHVSMIGFGDDGEETRALNGQTVAAINTDLTAAADLTRAHTLDENAGLAFRGNQKGGPFDIAGDVARAMLGSPNPNGRPNSEVVRPWVNGLDIVGRPRGMWLVDFGIDMPLEQASLYEQPFEYVREHVYPVRRGNNVEACRERWWIHTRTRPDMRRALGNLPRFFVTPHVSKHRLFAWVKNGIVPDHQLIVFARDDDYLFGVLHSAPHELWARGTGTQLREVESGFRYTPTTCFETFPFPWPPGTEPAEDEDPRVAAIARAARALVEQRDRWLNPGTLDARALKARTLTNLYNQNPTWLQLAHKALDDAVFDAYGWPYDLDDEAILERLLALNLERAGVTGAA